MSFSNAHFLSQIESLNDEKLQVFNFFWFRRDLRLDDNHGLFKALSSGKPVVPVFIFDSEILKHLREADRRVLFIWQQIQNLKSQLQEMGSDLLVFYGSPLQIFKQLFSQVQIQNIFCNHDYEPQAIARDLKISKLATDNNSDLKTFKDQVVFERSQILTESGRPYTVFTPYKKKWLSLCSNDQLGSFDGASFQKNFFPRKKKSPLISLSEMNFTPEAFDFSPAQVSKTLLSNYADHRNFPAQPATSQLGIHLRFGTVSVRQLVKQAQKVSDVWLSELIWREFFMQILFHYPQVVDQSFRSAYDRLPWRDQPAEFKKWTLGKTGYPLVDAGMRQLRETGWMHNRVRMVVGSFLTKHLFIHWLKGERFFADWLLDYDLSANNGNWQWVVGSGCDAAPYFRIFNPMTQIEKFDPQYAYIRRWVPEYQTPQYPEPMVDHVFARQRALENFKFLKGDV